MASVSAHEVPPGGAKLTYKKNVEMQQIRQDYNRQTLLKAPFILTDRVSLITLAQDCAKVLNPLSLF